MENFWEQPVKLLCMGTKEARALKLLKVRTLAEFAHLDLERVFTLGGYGATTYQRLQSHQKRLLEHEHGSSQIGTEPEEVPFDVITRSVSTRTMHTLEKLGVTSVQSLVGLKDEQVLNCRGAGKGVLADIKRIQKQYKPIVQEASAWRNTPASNESLEHLPLFSNVLLDISDVDLHDSYLPYQQLQNVGFPDWLRPYLGHLPARTLGELLLLPGKSLLKLEGFGRKKLEQLREFTRAYLGMSLLGHSYHTEDASLKGLFAFPLYTGVGNSQIQKATIHPSYRPASKIELLKLPARAKSLFESLRIRTIADVLLADPSSLLAQHNFGQTTLEITRMVLTDYILNGPELVDFTTNSHSLQEVVSKFLYEVLPTRLQQIMVLRLGLRGNPPMTLEDVATELRLTRERIRQIQFAAYKEVSSPANLYLLEDLRCRVRELTAQSGGRLSLSDLAQKLKCHYSWDSDCPPRLVKFIVELFDEYERHTDVISIPDFPCSYCNVPESAIGEVLANCQEVSSGFLSVVIARHCDRRQCKVYQDRHIAFSHSCISAYIAKRTSLRDSYVAHKETICCIEHHHIQYGKKQDAVEQILKLNAKPLHFTEVASAYKQYRPASALSENLIHGVLNNTPKAVLWDRGTFIHRDYVKVDSDLTRDISHWITQELNANCRFISIAGAYKHFRSRCQELGIQSETALYSYLRLENPGRFYLNRYPLVTLTSERVSISHLLEELVLESGGEVPRDELVRLLKKHGFDNSLSTVLANAPSLLYADNNRIVHVDVLNIDLRKFFELCKYAQHLLVTSSTITAAKVYHDKRITCKLLGFTGPRLLFSCFQMFGGDYVATGRYPQLRGLDNCHSKELSIRAELENYIKRHPPCSHAQLNEHFVESRGYNESTLESLPYYSENILRYAPKCYVHRDSLGWTGLEYGLLFRLLQDVIEQHVGQHKYASLKEVFDYHYNSLPQLPEDLPWTFVLLQSLAGNRAEIRFLGNARNAYVATLGEAPLPSLSAIIQDLLIREYNGAAPKEEVETRLVKEGIIMKTLTRTMLEEADGIVLKGKHLIVRSLCT